MNKPVLVYIEKKPPTFSTIFAMTTCTFFQIKTKPPLAPHPPKKAAQTNGINHHLHYATTKPADIIDAYHIYVYMYTLSLCMGWCIRN